MHSCRSFKFHSPCRSFKFHSPCGRTVFVEKLLKERKRLFSPPYNPVVYCYGANQPTTFARMQKEQAIHFYEGIPDGAMLDKWYKKSNGGLLVLDLFTKDSHHRNTTVIYMTQDMFPEGKFIRPKSRNAHYIIAFKNPQDQLGVRILTQQAFPQEFKDVLNVYREAIERPYRYLLFDLHPSSSDQERLKTNVLQDEGYTIVYRKRTG